MIELRDRLERLMLILRAADRRTTGLLPTHRALLRYLSRANRYSDTPGAAALYLGQTKGTVSQSLAVLERKGLVRKTPDREDRRVVRLQLTARGARVLGRDPDGADAALAQLPPGRARAISHALDVLLGAMQSATGGRGFGTCPRCRWLAREAGGPRCGLTREALEEDEIGRLCVDFDPAADRGA